LHFALTKEQNPSWTTGILPQIANFIPPVTSAGIGASEKVTLSSARGPVDSSPVDLFSDVLPLATPEQGLYSYWSGVFLGPIVDRLPGDAVIEYDYTTVFEVTAVPVPAAPCLFGTGLLGLVGMARRKAA
jgi:hypothetical protein